MASGEAETLQYTTTVLRVSIHCEGCKKKVKKVLHNIEGVYKVTVDAAQHKVTVTASVGADALIRRLHKAGKQAALWPAPAPSPVVEAAKKSEEVAPSPPAAAGEGDKVKEGAGKEDAKPKESAKDKKQPEAEGKDTKPDKPEAKKDVEATAPKEKGPPEPAKESAAAAEEAGGEEPGSGKKGKKKKNKQKDGGEAEAAAAEKTPQPSVPVPLPAPAPAPAPALGPERPPGGFPYYVAQPVMSYNVAHPSSSVSYYAPTPVGPMPTPPPYGYPPMVPPPMPEFLYGPPGIRSSPPQESYNMFNEENANSCSVM
ncbi:heavy metal-associated isoprenylated plant protein 35-like [Panicum virgatum]|nr:heavy metal-associated isoprenylated plant protein 35-like [Panicum virgatum]